MKVLVICAHPDDETFGAGGTIAKHIINGDKVNILVFTDNLRSPDIFKYSRKAIKILGGGKIDVEYLKLADSKLETFTMLRLARWIEGYLKLGIPDIVYTHYEHDLSVDHRLVFEATLTAFRPLWGKPIDILSFEVPSGTDWASQSMEPNLYVDIEETFDLKIKAMKCYETEIREYPHPRSEEAIRALAQIRGVQSGLKYAEAFKVIRMIR